MENKFEANKGLCDEKTEINMAEHKVRIKINYDGDKYHKSLSEPKMVTVWHTRRILAALGILALLVGLPFLPFSGTSDKRPADIEKEDLAEKEMPLTAKHQANKTDGLILPPNIPAPLQGDKAVKRQSGVPVAIIYNKRVIRASLNSGQQDSEPYLPVKRPIRLGPGQKQMLFYFSELRNSDDKVLYHVWSKAGLVVEKKRLSLKNNQRKLFSRRGFTDKNKGEWRVQLIDEKNRVLSGVDFWVNP